MASPAQDLTDRTIYPVEDDMGEHELQTYIRELLRPLLARFLAQVGKQVHVGSDQFIYWKQYEPTESLAPDIYVLPGVSQDLAIASWKVWENGNRVPSFALEIVSSDWEKDYLDGPRKYDRLGAAELILFDPNAKSSGRLVPGGSERVTWQLYRRQNERLALVRRVVGDRIFSPELGCWLRTVGTKDSLRIRIGLGELGEDLFPTIEEQSFTEKIQAEARAAQAEAEKAQAEAEKAQAEAEKAQAQRRIAELEAQLASHVK